MNLVNKIPILVLHVLKANVPQNARIVNENINSTKALYGRINNPLAIGNAIVIGHGLSSILLDFVNDNVGSLSHFVSDGDRSEKAQHGLPLTRTLLL